MTVETISLRGIGWATIGNCIAIVRLRDRPGFAVGVQATMRSDGIGRVWPTMPRARRRARFLARLHGLPIVEAC